MGPAATTSQPEWGSQLSAGSRGRPVRAARTPTLRQPAWFQGASRSREADQEPPANRLEGGVAGARSANRRRGAGRAPLTDGRRTAAAGAGRR